MPKLGCVWYQPTILRSVNLVSISRLTSFQASWVKVTSPALLAALSPRIDSSTRHKRPVVVAVPVADQHAADLQRGFSSAWAAIAPVDRRIEIDAKRLPSAAGKGASRADSRCGKLGDIDAIGHIGH